MLSGHDEQHCAENGCVWPVDEYEMNVDIAMKRLWIVAASLFAGIGLNRAQDGVDKAMADAFDARMLAGHLGKNADACLVRRYDANHPAQHPKQKSPR
jgi:hypothetical protein